MAETLLVGAVDNAAAPSAASAVLYRLSDGYGVPAGTDTPALVESTDVTPVGPMGRCVFRRLMVPFRYAGAVTLRITPIVDLETELASVTRTYTAPATPTRDVMEVAMATTGTYLRARIEVIARTGLVELYQPSLAFRPLGTAATGVVGPQST